MLPRRRAQLQQRGKSNGKKIIDRRTARGELHGACNSAPTLDEKARECIRIDRS